MNKNERVEYIHFELRELKKRFDGLEDHVFKLDTESGELEEQFSEAQDNLGDLLDYIDAIREADKFLRNSA
jgi:uncharacterized coiled-coil DUF342 family protein